MKLTIKSLLLAAFLLAAVPAVADETAENTAPPPPCGQSEASHFDFWLGEWDVETNGKVVGRNRITKIHGGCTVLEQYHALGGSFEGRSFNYYDLADSNWHQVWVDNSGTRLHLTGGFAAGQMVMSGERTVHEGTVIDRISWTDNADGTVRQLWELSGDDGTTWQVLFDGLYCPAEDGNQGEDR